MASLNSTQITVLNWFFNCHKNGELASYKGSIQHFGEVLKISEPMDVLMSLLNMGLISINKTKFEVSITKAGIQYLESIRRK